MLRLIAGLIAVVTALGGFMSWKYDTTSTCAAAGVAIRDETPKMLDELAETDARFRALKVSGALIGGIDTLVAGVAGEIARREVEDLSAFECAYLVGWRELDSSGFRQDMGARLADALAEQLRF